MNHQELLALLSTPKIDLLDNPGMLLIDFGWVTINKKYADKIQHDIYICPVCWQDETGPRYGDVIKKYDLESGKRVKELRVLVKRMSKYNLYLMGESDGSKMTLEAPRGLSVNHGYYYSGHDPSLLCFKGGATMWK